MLQEPVKLPKKTVLLYYHLLPGQGVTGNVSVEWIPCLNI